MKKIIIDFKRLSKEHKDLFFEKYPRGYSKKGIITFNNSKGVIIEALELITEDAVYLVKLNKIKFNKTEHVFEEDFFSDFETYENVEEILKAKDAMILDYLESELEDV